jgi:hypothetical protein
MATSFHAPVGSIRYSLCVAGVIGLLLAGAQAAAAPAQKPRRDRSGDPLPEGALYRLGPSRFRAGFHVSFLAFSKDGKTLLSVNHLNDHSRVIVRRWETSTGKQIRQFPLPETLGEEQDVALSSDGAFLAATPVGGVGEPITILNAVTGRVVRRFGKQMHGSGIAFSADGKTLATVHAFEPIRLWETATGRERLRIPVEKGYVHQLRFSPDGSKLVSINSEDNALVWQLLRRAPGQAPAALTEKQLRALWAELASKDGRTAFRALRQLSAAAPGPVAAFFRRELERKVPHETLQQIARWIAQLDADQFEVREKASRELTQLGDVAEPLLRKALQGGTSPEKRRRLQALLSKVARVIESKNIRKGRMVEVLEHLATPEARKVLQSLAEGEPADRLSHEARAALQRLDRAAKK